MNETISIGAFLELEELPDYVIDELQVRHTQRLDRRYTQIYLRMELDGSNRKFYAECSIDDDQSCGYVDLLTREDEYELAALIERRTLDSLKAFI